MPKKNHTVKIHGELVKTFKKCAVIFQENNGPRGAYVVVPNNGDICYVGGRNDAYAEARKYDRKGSW